MNMPVGVMPNPKDKPHKIVIEGVTTSGKQFRPSDWAERMSGTLASFSNRRIRYSPLLQPTVNAAGYQCVVLDPALQQSNPSLYNSILEFAKNNNLKICDEEDKA
jgi:hypothetical protein